MDTIRTIQSLLTCNGSAQPVTVGLTQSDFRLIAAAPDLLEALRDVLSGAVHYQLREDEQCVLDARAAILKATGEGA